MVRKKLSDPIHPIPFARQRALVRAVLNVPSAKLDRAVEEAFKARFARELLKISRVNARLSA
jgi:hypothetical protein